MFSSYERLKKRTPQNGVDRENYLSMLVDEFINTKSHEAKNQVLANLANFSYDPINYSYVRDVGVIDIFIHVLKSECNDQNLVKYSCIGICNLCTDSQNVEYLISVGAVDLIVQLLNCDHVEILKNGLTSLLYMNSPLINSSITKPKIIARVKSLLAKEDKQLSNIATIYLRDVCKVTS